VSKRALCVYFMLLTIFALGSQIGQSADSPVTLRFMTFFAFAGNGMEIHEEMIDQFEKENPDINIQIEQVDYGQYAQKLLTMVAGNMAPDIMAIDVINMYVPWLAQTGILLNLENYIKNDSEMDAVFPALWEPTVLNGARYAVPFSMDLRAMAYMPNNFAESGLVDPVDAFTSGRWTWDQLRSDLKKLTVIDQDGRHTQIGMFLQGELLLAMPFVYQTGATPFSPTLRQAQYTDQRIAAALEYLRALAAEDRTLSLDGWGYLQIGKFGVWPQNVNIPYWFKSTQVMPELVPFVDGPVKGINAAASDAMAIAATTKHPEAAWRFLRFLTGRVGSEYMVRNDLTPAVRSAWPYYLQWLSGKPGYANLKLFLDDMNRIRTMQLPPEFGRINDLSWAMLAPVFQGTAALQPTLEDLQTKVNAILAEFWAKVK
jgi:multiple sugar transport system substrate-binding protein